MERPQICFALCLLRELIEFGSGEEECAHAVDVAGGWLELPGLSADGLYGAEAAVGVDVGEHALPGFCDDGQIHLAIKKIVVDSPGEAVGEEGSAGDFGIGVGARI